MRGERDGFPFFFNFIMKWTKKFEKDFLNKLFKRRDEYLFIITINKTQAAILLSINDPGNRKKQPELVETYINLMNQNKWETRRGSFIGLGYFDIFVSDGQHRLEAFLKSNMEELTTYVCFG